MDTTCPPQTRIERLRTMDVESWMDVGDPPAEAVITALRTRTISSANPLPAIRRLAAAGDPACRDFLADVSTPAPWADFDRMRLGGAMGYRYFPQLIVALLHGGLMTTFSSPDSAYILAGTHRLEQNVVRRLFESATLFFGVLDTESLRPGGGAWEICVRVRLLHAMIRLQLVADWPLRGTPINTLQVAAGPLFFGAMVLDRLRSLGAIITVDEADGFYLIWRHVTRLLGVPDDLLGDTAAEQAVLDAKVLPYSFEPDQNSRQLADILLTGLKRLPGAGRLPRAVHEILARYMLGAQRADGMGIPRHRLGDRAIRALAPGLATYGWLQRIPVLARGLERLGDHCLAGLLDRGLAGVAADFQPLHPADGSAGARR